MQEKRIALLNAAKEFLFRTKRLFLKVSSRFHPVIKKLRQIFSWQRLLLLAGFFVVAAVLTVFLLVRDLPTPETFAERTIAQSTILYDRTGDVILYDIHGDEKRRIVPLTEISQYLIDATIVAEDDRFYSHVGVDPAGILRSIFINIIEGERAQGGSTITQQLVRNAVLTLEKTYTRKIREIFLALALELRFSKDEILSAYLNQISYGSLVYGVEAASQTYFGKSVTEISLTEAATLAAIPKATSYYSPHGDNRDELFARKDFIVRRMFSLGYIDAAIRDEALSSIPEVVLIQDAIIAPHFVFYVQEELEQRFGKERVEQGGLRVITTLDASLQELAETAIEEGAERNQDRYGAENAALISLDPKTGEILAMVGSRDYFSEDIDGNVNVTIRQRQPGSSFKPIVYAAAFEKGYTPDTILFDLPTNFGIQGSKEYSPRNYTGTFHGPVTARQALANSLNIPAVKMLYLTGVHEAVAFAEKLGISTLTDPHRYGLSLVLGGGAVTLLEETSAFGVFAADGMRAAPESILKVEDSNGKILYEYVAEPSRVIRKEIARQISDILSDNAARALVYGTRTALVLPDRPVAAKTGTTQDFRDAWTVGFTPSLVTGVWVGNNDYSPMRGGAAGSIVAAPIWNQFMRSALKDTPVETFPKPKAITTGKAILDGEFAAPQIIRIDKASGKLATELTPASWVEERAYGTVHDTLYWIDRNDPRGPAPENPASDPQFEEWERGVQEWFSIHSDTVVVSTEAPPTEEDDIHVPENAPTLVVFSPNKNQILEESFMIIVSGSAPLGLKTITYTLGSLAVGSLSPERNTPNFYAREVFLPDLGDTAVLTPKDLIVRAFDIFGNVTTSSVRVRVWEASVILDSIEETSDE